jgi:hypothetical protein
MPCSYLFRVSERLQSQKQFDIYHQSVIKMNFVEFRLCLASQSLQGTEV